MRRVGVFATLVGLLGLLWIAGPVVSQDAPKNDAPLLSELVGTYDYVGDRQKDQAAIAASIDATVSKMGRFARGIATDKLTKANKIPAVLKISTKDSEVVLSLDKWTVTAPTDGSKRPITTPLGDKGKASFHVKSATLIQEIETRQATRTNQFRFTDDGKLIMKVKEAGSKLPVPVEYELHYKPRK